MSAHMHQDSDLRTGQLIGDPADGSISSHSLPMPLEFVSERSRIFHEYWWSLHRPDQDGAVPERSAFDPAAVTGLLPFLALHDLSEPGVSRMRLVGTGITRRLGFDPTGRNYFDMVAEHRRPESRHTLASLVGRPCGALIMLEWCFPGGKTQRLEVLGYPLRGRRDGQPIPMVMFVHTLLGKPSFDMDQQAVDTHGVTVTSRTFIDIGYGLPAPP